MAGGFGHCNVTHQSFGSEAGDFWHGGSFGHCGPSRPQTDRQTDKQTDKKAECPRFEETKYIQHQLKPTNACVQDLIKSDAYSIIQR